MFLCFLYISVLINADNNIKMTCMTIYDFPFKMVNLFNEKMKKMT